MVSKTGFRPVCHPILGNLQSPRLDRGKNFSGKDESEETATDQRLLNLHDFDEIAL
jgi:hypothetical protein